MYRKAELERDLKDGGVFSPVMADGIEVYCLKDARAKFSKLEIMSHIYHLQMRVIVKDSATDNEWHLLKYSPKSAIQVYHIIRNFMDGSKYCVIDYKNDYDHIANCILEKAATSGSAVEVKRAYEDIAAVEALLKDRKIGGSGTMQLVVNEDTLEHIYVQGVDNSLTFKNITLTYCLMIPTDDMACKALDIIKERKQVPSVIGMMPEDVIGHAKRNNIELNFDSRLAGEGNYIADEGAFYGPFIILDESDEVGYALRYTYDGLTFFWAAGDHFNISLVKSSEVHEKGRFGNVDLSQLSDNDIVSWMPITSTVECDKYGGFTCVE